MVRVWKPPSKAAFPENRIAVIYRYITNHLRTSSSWSKTKIAVLNYISRSGLWTRISWVLLSAGLTKTTQWCPSNRSASLEGPFHRQQEWLQAQPGWICQMGHLHVASPLGGLSTARQFGLQECTR